MPSTLWNTREVAAYLNVKESTIRHWVHIGYIPHIKFRGLVRYQQETIDEWLSKCTVGMRRTPGKIAQEILEGRHETPGPGLTKGKGENR